MFERKDKKQEGGLIEKPQDEAKSSKHDSAIHVMPEKFLGASLDPKPKEVVKTVIVEKPAPPPVKPKPVKPKKIRWWIWVLVAIVIIAIFGGGAYYIISQLPEESPVEPPPVVLTCGDSIRYCETEDDCLAENYYWYNADCHQSPEPMCADSIQYCETEDDCLAEGYYWYSDECNREPESEPEVSRSGIDTDSDGLTDTEENDLYGTDYRNPDSDNDEFLDGNEVFHRYNPLGNAPVTLLESGLVSRFESEGFSYTTLYPSAWSPVIVGGDTEGIMFNIESGEVIQILVQAKEAEQSLAEWFTTQSPESDPRLVENIVTKNGYQGIRSPDDLTVYLEVNGSVYVISYNLGSKNLIDYRQTFEMMINSFEVN